MSVNGRGSIQRFLLLLFLLLPLQSLHAQTAGVPPPPSVADFVAPFEDPLKTNPQHMIQPPVNLFTGATADCVMADQILQSNNAELAAKRLQAYTQTNSGEEEPILTLQAALDLGLCHNPQLRMSWSDIKLQASQVGQAKAAYLPQVSASVMPQRSITHYNSQNGRTSETTQSTSAYIGLSWRILDFGTRSATLEAAYYQLAGAIHSQNETLQKSIIGILQSYYEALTKKSEWQARVETTELAEQTLASAQRRLENGAGSKNDLLQAQSSLSRSKLEATKAQGEYQKATASLVFMIGLPAETTVALDNTLETDMQAMLDVTLNKQQKTLVELGLQEWLTQAKYAHPSIAAARARWNASQAEVKAVSAQGLPTIDVGANYYRNGRPTDSASNIKSSETSLAVTITIPLFTGFESTYRVRGAQAQAERARLEMEGIEQQVMLEIIHTHADAQAAWKNLTEAENFYTAALEARASSQRQFENGVIDITQVIQAQSFLVDANLQRIQAHAQWQIAKMSLIVQSYTW